LPAVGVVGSSNISSGFPFLGVVLGVLDSDIMIC
jgi:hypothetical protein